METTMTVINFPSNDDVTEAPESVRTLRHRVQEVAQSLNDDLSEQVSHALAGRSGMSFTEQRECATAARAAFEQYAASIGATTSSEGSLGTSLKVADETLAQIITMINTREAEANKPPAPESPEKFLAGLLAQAQAGYATAKATQEVLAAAEASAQEALSTWEALREDVQTKVDALSASEPVETSGDATD
jgi:uncharacterized protein YoxC